MGSTNISALRDRHKGETAYLIGSGSSLNYVPKKFFNDKLTVGVNATHRDFLLKYVFAHHREDAQEAISKGHTVVASEFDQGRTENGHNVFEGDWYQYRHPQQPSTLVMNMEPLERDLHDALVIGSNTVTSAMDFLGRILGVAVIILCGVDSGTIDGRWNYEGYNGGEEVDWLEQQTRGGSGLPHVRAQVPLIATVAEALRARGVVIMSNNPFVDLGLEGHVFAR